MEYHDTAPAAERLNLEVVSLEFSCMPSCQLLWKELSRGVETLHLLQHPLTLRLRRINPVTVTLSMTISFHCSKYRSGLRSSTLLCVRGGGTRGISPP